MQYEVSEKFGKVSKLGFGAMRFPMKGEQIDQEQVDEMIRIAYEAGVNYFEGAVAQRGCPFRSLINPQTPKFLPNIKDAEGIFACRVRCRLRF